MRQDDIVSEFEGMFLDFARRAGSGRFVPNCDVYVDEKQGRIVVAVELAGADAESLRVGVDNRALFILGRRVEHAACTGSFLQKEIQYGEFVKKLHLPVPVDHQEITATYRDGILTIVLPLSETAYFPTSRTEIRMTVRRTPV